MSLESIKIKKLHDISATVVAREIMVKKIGSYKFHTYRSVFFIHYNMYLNIAMHYNDNTF